MSAPDLHTEPDHRPEWVGGVVTLPTHVTEGGKTYQPSVILWIDAATEMILGVSTVDPEGALAAAGASLRETTRDPKAGRPTMPGRVRVATPELADALRQASIDGLEVVCAPTPELDRAIDSLLEHLAEDDEAPGLRYLQGDVTAEGTAAMFRAAARLYRTKPWEIVPFDSSLIGVTCEALGLRDAAISVMGQAGKTYGFVLFASFDDFQQFWDAANTAPRGQLAGLPRHLALTYARRADVGRGLLSEIAAHRWELANAAAYPVISAADANAVGRGPTRSEMLRIEAIAASLAEILREFSSELDDAFQGERSLVFRKTLATSAGDVEMAFSVPHPAQEADRTLLDDDGELDDDRARAYRAEVLDQFRASPEARTEPEAHWAGMLVDYAASYFGTTAESLSAADLHELVFDVIPRKVSVEPQAAPGIIAGFRAFLAFLQRERPDRHASARSAVLEGTASQKLARLLANPLNFGPAKSFVMSGRAAGFDMSSQAGLNAWAEHMHKNNLRVPMGFPPSAAEPRESATKQRAAPKAKKAKRKAQRAARHKNRSR